MAALSAPNQHSRAESHQHHTENTGQGLIRKRAHEITSKPRCQSRCGSDDRNYFPVDQISRPGIADGRNERGNDDYRQRSGDRLLLLEASRLDLDLPWQCEILHLQFLKTLENLLIWQAIFRCLRELFPRTTLWVVLELRKKKDIEALGWYHVGAVVEQWQLFDQA
jgi:hypothetical protein